MDGHPQAAMAAMAGGMAAGLPALAWSWDLAYAVMSHTNAGRICGLSCSSDGRWIGVAMSDESVVVIDAHNGFKIERRIPGAWVRQSISQSGGALN